MSEVSINLSNQQPQLKEEQIGGVETAGTIAKATNTPSPLFNAVETSGSIASSNSSDSSGTSGGTNYVC